MAIQLVPLKVKIGLRPNGHADHPLFNDLDPAVRGDGIDWSIYIDKVGGGWHYDKKCGHREADAAADSPVGMQWGCILVPEDFATAAIAMFGPDGTSPTQKGVVEEINEVTFETFYDTRAHAHEPGEIRDTDVLQALAAKKVLGIAQTQDDLDALDPAKPQAGIRANPRKTWAQAKALEGRTILARLKKVEIEL